MTHEQQSVGGEPVNPESASDAPENPAAATGLAVGVSCGVAIGLPLGLLVFDNIGLGLALGLGIGSAIGAGLPALRQSRRSGPTDAA
ncbi:hypothetical protein ACWGHM_27205 [Streptomyces sp. NPDC054904]|uniref:hypothetical protein n=1 Tax=unclassified Streptomyces TaxID=2593676 RepID=UPI002481FB80|nr:hypothetical protein [Streptomyces sp. Isolate_45]MDA5279398.1 hypothetical protein [Streptomyces sp. Isolate_45]